MGVLCIVFIYLHVLGCIVGVYTPTGWFVGSVLCVCALGYLLYPLTKFHNPNEMRVEYRTFVSFQFNPVHWQLYSRENLVEGITYYLGPFVITYFPVKEERRYRKKPRLKVIRGGVESVNNRREPHG